MPAACPVLWDSERKEPYIPLPSFPDLRLTPSRSDEDGPQSVLMCNHPDVGKYSYRRAYPYALKDYQHLVSLFGARNNQARDALISVIQSDSGVRDDPPFLIWCTNVLRYVPSPKSPSDPADPTSADPTQTRKTDLSKLGMVSGQLQGGIYLFPSGQAKLGDESTDDYSKEREMEMPYDLMPILHGRGIGREMVEVVVGSWCAWTGLNRIVAQAQIDNPASNSVLRRNGFQLVDQIINVWPEEKGGGERVIGVWKWENKAV